MGIKRDDQKFLPITDFDRIGEIKFLIDSKVHANPADGKFYAEVCYITVKNYFVCIVIEPDVLDPTDRKLKAKVLRYCKL